MYVSYLRERRRPRFPLRGQQRAQLVGGGRSRQTASATGFSWDAFFGPIPVSVNSGQPHVLTPDKIGGGETREAWRVNYVWSMRGVLSRDQSRELPAESL